MEKRDFIVQGPCFTGSVMFPSYYKVVETITCREVCRVAVKNRETRTDHRIAARTANEIALILKSEDYEPANCKVE